MSDAPSIPDDLIDLKRARIEATNALKALPDDAPQEHRQELRDAEYAAARALWDHPAYDPAKWAELEAAARRAE